MAETVITFDDWDTGFPIIITGGSGDFSNWDGGAPIISAKLETLKPPEFVSITFEMW